MGMEIKLPNIPEEEQTPLVKGLLAIIEQLSERVQRQEEEIGHLKDEIAVLKGEKKRPRFKPSKLDQKAGKDAEGKEKGGQRRKGVRASAPVRRKSRRRRS